MNNENQFNQVDLLFDPVRALAHVVRMRNITLTNKPDHEFVAYFNEIETTLRKMREKNEKLAAMVEYMTRQQDKFSTSTPVNVVEHSEKAPPPKEKLSDEDWLRKPLNQANLNF